MAYGSPNPGHSMAEEESYFNDGPKSEPKDMQKEGMEQTGLLPKALMAGKDFKVGDEIMMKITAIHEKDFAVEYAPEKGAEEEAEGPHDEGAEMAGMGESGGGGMEEMY